MKTPKILWFSGVFRVYKTGILTGKGISFFVKYFARNYFFIKFVALSCVRKQKIPGSKDLVAKCFLTSFYGKTVYIMVIQFNKIHVMTLETNFSFINVN